MRNLGSIFKRRKVAIDMTKGTPLKRILVFMIPLVIGNIFQQMYSMVDTVIVGRALGKNALSGVGSTGAISFLILGFVSGLTQGFAIMVSQRRGARDGEGMRYAFATGLVLTLVLVSALTVVGVFCARPLLVAMNTYEEYLPYAETYITTIFSGMLLSALYNQFSSTLRAIGDSVVPLYFLIFAAFLNVGMDSLFVMGMDMGVSGAAIATVASNGISAVATFVYMWVRYPELRLGVRHFMPDIKRYGRHLRLGIPMALQLSVVSIGMIFGQSALNGMHPDAITAYIAAGKIDGLATSIINSTGAAAATFVGQNYGAKKYARIRSGIKQFALFSVCLCAVLSTLVLSLHRPLVMLFISSGERSEALYGYALRYLAFNAGCYMLLATLCISRSALQGMGRGTLTLIAAATEVVMRVGVSLVAMKFASYTVVCMCNCMSWLGANFILLPTFTVVMRKYARLFGKMPYVERLPNPSEIPFVGRERH